MGGEKFLYHCRRVSSISCAGTHVAARVDLWDRGGVLLFL